MKKVFVLAPILVFLFTLNTTFADRTVWYVHLDSTLNTIQAGLDSCSDNDTVLVGPGTYFECINWPNTQGIHLISELGPEMTVIDGDSVNDWPVIGCTSWVDTSTMIKGFTIQNGIYGIASMSRSPKIIGNKIMHNHTPNQGSGGGIRIHHGQPAIILDNYIADNHACSGGGICWDVGTAIIIGNTIVNNEGWGWSRPGVSAICGDTLVLRNNHISGNYGFVYFCISCTYAIIESCMIYDNNSIGTCIACWGNSEIHYCDIFGNGYAVNGGFPIHAEYNWWGDSTGPYHPYSNPGGLGDTVGNNVAFIPWLCWPGVQEQPTSNQIANYITICSTIFSGPLILPEGKNCTIFDITGRVVMPQHIRPGIYFLEIDGKVVQKVIKIR